MQNNRVRRRSADREMIDDDDRWHRTHAVHTNNNIQLYNDRVEILLHCSIRRRRDNHMDRVSSPRRRRLYIKQRVNNNNTYNR